MLKEISGGDIFSSIKYDAIVCPVNCVGVMGKGLALECKNRYPNLYDNYRLACLSGFLKPGEIFGVVDKQINKDKHDLVICLATKNDWRHPSKLEWITNGVKNLVRWLDYWILNGIEIKTIAVPMLGCGCGGLDRPLVLDIIRSGLTNTRHDFYLFT